MSSPRPKDTNPFGTPSNNTLRHEPKEEWEDWSDEEAVTPIVDEFGEEPLIDLPPETGPNAPRGQSQPQAQTRASAVARQSIHKMKRLKSRHRQKAQNAKAGIKLETDMSKFLQQRQQQHVAYQMRLSPGDRQSRTGRFVDAAALRALEGDPSSPSIGSFAWLKRKPKDASKTKKADKNLKTPKPISPQDLSPNERPIMIGFEMPIDSDVTISPNTAVVETPVDFFPMLKKSQKAPSQPQLISAWSPDTEDERSLYRSSRTASSIYSLAQSSKVPPVPAFPASLRNKRQEERRTTIITTDDEDDMAGTPVTLFEESPASPRKLPLIKGRDRAPTDASSRSQGWWDQVTTPFGPSPVEPLPTSSKSPSEEASEWWKQRDEKKLFAAKEAARNAGGASRTASPSDEWWKGVDEKKVQGAKATASPSAESSFSTTQVKKRPVQIVIQEPSPPPTASSSRSEPSSNRPETHAEKALILAEEALTPSDQPPPYEPPSRQQLVRYRAVFPPGHHLNNLYPPSPGPVSPGLTRTMTSQGAIDMADVPLTPPPVVTHSRDVPLPDRPTGAFVSGDHFLEVTGRGPRQRAERRRRRHEKEDAVARKVGGFWKGRGCIPANGCYGREGREGRKRRRLCLGIFGGVIALIILTVVLAVTLTHRAADSAVYSPWLNLTDFPPMPTGVLTVVAPDNSDAISGCVSPPTLWSCSLPKEQTPGNKPFAANQPKFVFQIQYDNNTRKLWDVTNGQPPQPTPNTNGQGTLQRQNQTLGGGNTSNSNPGSVQGEVSRRDRVGVVGFLRQILFGRDAPVYDPGFVPSPDPPSFQDMWFLGNTSDGIVSNDKAGEPTPFYITFMQSVDTPPVGPNMVTRRDKLLLNETVPPPALNADGTGAPAVLLPRPVQQPLRLYDRGLPTEHYGFYTYFSKTIYTTAVGTDTLLGDSSGVVQTDQDGGALESEANFLTTWGMTRFKVEFWTRSGNNTRLLSGGQGVLGDNSTRPGTFPYPMALTADTHGGQPNLKGTYSFNVTRDQHIDTSGFSFKLVNYGLGGEQVNPAGLNNTSFGGFDGGTGGCKCVYKNFVGVTTQ